MEGSAKRKSKTIKKVSSIKKKKVTPTELSNEELLDKILSKKKKTTKKKVEPVKVKPKLTKEEKAKLSNDELLDLIMAKKKKKKKVVKKTTTAKKPKETVKVKTKKELPETQTLFDKNLLEEVQKELEVKKEEISKQQRNKELIHKRFVRIRLAMISISFVALFIFTLVSLNNNDQITFSLVDKIDISDVKKIEEDKMINYQACLAKEYDESEETELINQKKKEITDYLEKNYRVRVVYEDLTYGYSYKYQEDDVVYAASTIKALGALYIYKEAAAGNLSLDETMTYLPRYRLGSSEATGKLSYGTKITLRDLVKYAVTVSDNSAYNMIVSYIGFNKLQEFGYSLGAQNTLKGGDNFGNITANDGVIYMKAVYDFIQNNGELGKELESYFMESDDNYLVFEDKGIKAITKYGNYDVFYHNIGVVYDEHPYAIAIITTDAYKKPADEVKDINNKIYELHSLYYSNRQETCRLEVYGE